MKAKPTIMLVGLGGLGSVLLVGHHGGLLCLERRGGSADQGHGP